MYCKVYLLDVPYHIDRPFDYSVGDNVSPGAIVRVPFGKSDRLRLGVIFELCDTAQSEKVKPVHSVVCDGFSLNREMIGICLFLKNHTLCTFGEAVRSILPPGALAERQNVKYVYTCRLNINKEELDRLLSAKGRAGIRSAGQREVLRYLRDIGSADMELIRALVGVNSTHIKALSERGVITLEARELYRNPYSRYAKNPDKTPVTLSRAQNEAYLKIEELYSDTKARAALLFGVTGSGKTKVIMKAIDKTVADGKSVIMLVPEIALTPQTVGIFCKRYGERVAVIHSSLSQGERLDAYRRIRDGGVDLVIGTRSAIFAPLDNIGMIVIDEEHEHTYKSDSDPKYHARDVAAYRAGAHGALMLLASATPSLESFYKARSGVYTLVPLYERYGGVRLPRAVVVDMREELRLGNTSPISKRLLDELSARREAGEQTILFLNRRGYNTQISCKSCGEVISCPRCSVTLTYHNSPTSPKLMCHLCGHTEPVPKACPACRSEGLSFLGFGTQKLEGELSKYLPSSTVMRMDADTTSGKLAYDRMLEDFRGGCADILLGTQMVAKGHDFPRVTLVGVALADTSLYISDFRASERTFSLLTQVVGRAGRASDNGVAVIQTYSPKNEIIRLACEQDYEKFYEGEIAIRRELSYPPFCDMVQLTLTADNERELYSASERLKESALLKMGGKYKDLPFVAFGPHEAQIYKLNEKYRTRMVVKCKLNSRSRELFSELLSEFSTVREAQLSIDLNPLTV